MDCPACKTPMVDEDGCCSCSDCGGVWFTPVEARDYFGFASDEAAVAVPDASAPAVNDRLCPSCLAGLHHFDVGESLGLDRCGGCGGLYFDAGESLKLRSLLAVGHDGPTLRARMLGLVGAPGSGPYR